MRVFTQPTLSIQYSSLRHSVFSQVSANADALPHVRRGVHTGGRPMEAGDGRTKLIALATVGFFRSPEFEAKF